MTHKEASALPLGLYRLEWHGGGSSLAAVYHNDMGVRLFCCANWVSGPSSDWPAVRKAILLWRVGRQEESDARRLALAVLSGDEVAAMLLADLVQQEYLSGAAEGD